MKTEIMFHKALLILDTVKILLRIYDIRHRIDSHSILCIPRKLARNSIPEERWSPSTTYQYWSWICASNCVAPVLGNLISFSSVTRIASWLGFADDKANLK